MKKQVNARNEEKDMVCMNVGEKRINDGVRTFCLIERVDEDYYRASVNQRMHPAKPTVWCCFTTLCSVHFMTVMLRFFHRLCERRGRPSDMNADDQQCLKNFYSLSKHNQAAVLRLIETMIFLEKQSRQEC